MKTLRKNILNAGSQQQKLNALGFINALEITEERISELKDMSKEIFQLKSKRKIKTELSYNYSLHMHNGNIIRQKGMERTFELLMVEEFPKLVRNKKPQNGDVREHQTE